MTKNRFIHQVLDLTVLNPYVLYRWFTILYRRESIMRNLPSILRGIIQDLNWPEGPLKKYLKVAPGGAYVDVGANEGIYVFHLAHSADKVYAFEPNPETFKKLCRNTWGFSNVVAVEAALGNLCGIKTLFVHRDSGHNSLYAKGGDAICETSVLVLTLDSVDMDVPVNLLKIDTEGGELEILRGARNTILKYRPRVIVEVLLQDFDKIASFFLEMSGAYHVKYVAMKRRLAPQYWVVADPYRHQS